MSLNDLPDQTLNALCCKALGWEWSEYLGRWRVPVECGFFSRDREVPFTHDLNLIQQYLVTHLQQDWGLRMDYVHHLQCLIPYPGGDYGEHGFLAVNAPARVRVVAFLTALEVKE